MIRLCRQCFNKLKLRGQFYSTAENNGNLHVSEEVKSALHAGKPVVALETTIITHGMPYPDNLRMAREVEEVVRDCGAVPAPIAVLQGAVHVGLSDPQVAFLADPSTSAVKTSRRDLPYVTSQRLNGGTTVSGTMLIAHQAGIQLFATGGIGGVHRGAETSMDISADLTELSRTPVTVVSAGVKSILDIGRTLEYLETMGVCVASYGESRDFPAFFTRKSGFQAPFNVTSPTEAANLIYSSRQFGLETGCLFAVPVPVEYEAAGEKIETAIQSAVQEASRLGITGQKVTPFILDRVNTLTQGASLTSNIHLVKNNARVASEIAVELSNLTHTNKDMDRRHSGKTFNSVHAGKTSSFRSVQAGTDREQTENSGERQVAVVGGSIVDFYARLNVDKYKLNGGTYPGSVQQSFGGVGFNLANCLSRLGVNPLFVSAIGQDSHTAAYEAYCQHMDLSGVARLADQSTATYSCILDGSGHVLFGIGDMDIHAAVTPEYISKFENDLKNLSLVCIDGNISTAAIHYICDLCDKYDVPVWYEPTDILKAGQPFTDRHSSDNGIFYTTPNYNELRTMAAALSGQEFKEIGNCDENDLDIVLASCIEMLQFVCKHVPIVLVTLGKHGVILCYHGDRNSSLPIKGRPMQKRSSVMMEHYPATMPGKQPKSFVSMSGAGDCLASAMIMGIIEGRDLELCVKTGLMAAQFSLQSPAAVPSNIAKELFTEEVVRDWMPIKPTVLIQ